MASRTLNDAQRNKLRALARDFEYYAANCLKIRTKHGAVEPLRLNAAQQHIHRELSRQMADTGRVRAIILKGRQQGVSTYVEGRFYWRVTQRRGVRAFILTHEAEATANLFGMAQRYHALAPDAVKPNAAASNARELIFDGIDSGYKVGTAGNKGAGRSQTIQYCHGSEVAYWPHAEDHLAGILQAVPDAQGTEIILESTANGVGGVFYDYCMDARAGKGDYRLIFVPWFWQPEYRKRAVGFTATAEEAAIVKAHGLDVEQLAWRRAKISELKSESLFRQEYPCTVDEAFVFSGRLVFPAELVQAAKTECWSPLYRAAIDSAGKITKRNDGELRVWEDPKPGVRYVIGADVAEGLDHGDYSCADVLSVPDGRQVAQWHGHIDPDRFGAVLAGLGVRYNRALLGVERNNHGLTTVTGLLNGGYPHLYAQEDLEYRAEGKETKKAGWLTTEKSKLKIIDQLHAELRDGDHGLACADTTLEMGTYVIDPDNGKYGAKAGCYDDRVMSRAIAGEMVRVAGRSGVLRQTSAKAATPRPADRTAGY